MSKRTSFEQMVIDAIAVANSTGSYNVASLLRQLRSCSDFDDVAYSVEPVWKSHAIPHQKIKFVQHRKLELSALTDLSPLASKLWLILINSVTDTLIIDGKVKDFAELLGVSDRSVRDLFKELVDAGFLYIWRRGSGSKSNVYEVNPNIISSDRFGFHPSVLCKSKSSMSVGSYRGNIGYSSVEGVISYSDASMMTYNPPRCSDGISHFAMRRVSGDKQNAPYMSLFRELDEKAGDKTDVKPVIDDTVKKYPTPEEWVASLTDGDSDDDFDDI